MMVIKHKPVLWLLFILLGLTQSQLGAQTAQPALNRAEVIERKLASKLMARDMAYRVVMPADFKMNVSGRYPVVYLLHGLTGNFANWTDRTRLAEYALKHNFILVTPDGGNGWYTDSVSAPNDKYESYIVKELIPEIDKTYRTVATRDGRMIAGLSMGGYGSLKFGLKYPEMFSFIGSFSGALGATAWTEKTAGAIAKSMDAVFGPEPDNETRRANDIFRMVRETTPEKIKAMPYIFLSCGTEDFLIQNNRDFLGLLAEKRIPHEYRQLPGGHDWVFWNDQVREFLDVAARRQKK
jgi:S-formylglutathione hydrolase FrmB